MGVALGTIVATVTVVFLALAVLAAWLASIGLWWAALIILAIPVLLILRLAFYYSAAKSGTLASMGWIDALLAFFLFYLLVTPVSLVLRLVGRDVLHRRTKDRQSYWVIRKKPANGRDDLKSQA